MTELPTCWWCPGCGMVGGGHKLDCYSKSVEIPAIPPGTPLPVILDALGIEYRSLYTSADWVNPELIVLAVLEPSRIDGDVQVLVVDNPATDEAHDG